MKHENFVVSKEKWENALVVIRRKNPYKFLLGGTCGHCNEFRPNRELDNRFCRECTLYKKDLCSVTKEGDRAYWNLMSIVEGTCWEEAEGYAQEILNAILEDDPARKEDPFETIVRLEAELEQERSAVTSLGIECADLRNEKDVLMKRMEGSYFNARWIKEGGEYELRAIGNINSGDRIRIV